MTQLTQLIAQGISSGAIYGLVALSFVAVLCISAALCFLLEAKIMRRTVGRPQFLGVSTNTAACARGPSEHAANPSARRLRKMPSGSVPTSPMRSSCLRRAGIRRRGSLSTRSVTIRVIPRSLHQGDEELTPALRLNRRVEASRYANLFTEPLGV
ncbi:hypothetical protein LJR290_003177 [Variovorax sp. LjRoot290]|uniref:hypothetical protein n=1 Tax=Variovorax sp. LjRoot290 TaxID=3342316 RepID=UPI003ECCFE93